MSHVDEGLIHAWIEDQLPPDEAARIEQLVATDAAWGAAAAEARGLIAATARVIGALDSAPSAGALGTEKKQWTERTTKTSVPWVRRNWLRAAAVIALAAGVSGVWFTGGSNVASTDTLLNDAIRKESKPAAALESPTVSGQSAPAAPASLPKPAPSSVRRDQQAVANRPAPAPVSPPPTAVRDEIVAAAKSATTASDAVVERGVVGNSVGGAGGRGGGSGGVAPATTLLQRNEAQLADMSKSFAAVLADSVFRGCWIPTDSSLRESRLASERDATAPTVLRFTQAVVTDLRNRASVPLPSSPPQVSGITALRAAPARAIVQHATPRLKDDSTFVSEWLNADGRSTQLTFRLRGDTLRGTTSLIAGDLVIAGSAFVAVRAQCPR